MTKRGVRFLLRLYPRDFRKRYGDELVRCIGRDRERPQFAGRLGAFRFWTHTISDTALTALSEWRALLPSFRLEVDVHTLLTDLRFTLRSLWGNTRVTMIAALTLALGIGAATVILSVTKGVLLDPLPYKDSERLTLIWSEMPASGFTRYPISGPELNDLRTRSDLFEEFASIWTTTGAIVENDEPESVRLGLVLIGIAVGLAGALTLGRLMKGLLFDVAPSDPLTLTLVPLLLGAVTLVAGWLPARRAMRIDPAIVLREE